MNMKSGVKINVFLVWIVMVFFLLVLRLYYLQIIQGESYLQRSESNFIQERIIKHSRGRIFDSSGKTLVDNRLAYDVYVTFALLPDSLKNLRELASVLNIGKRELLDFNKELMEWARHNINDEVVLKTGVSIKSCQKIAELSRIKMIPGVIVRETNKSLQSFCQISINCSHFPSQFQTFRFISSLLDVESKNLDEQWQKAQRRSQGLGKFKPNLIAADVGFNAYARIENAISLGKLAGITVVPSKRRRYVQREFATHIIGFLNQVSVADIRQSNKAYRAGDYIGRNGLEATFEEVLRGKDGVEKVVVDAKGRRFDETWETSLLGKQRIIKPVSGLSLKLSIDSDMQKAAEELFLGRSGSVIISEVDTGFILALASFPSFDPNGLVSADNSKFFHDLISDDKRPLRNKAVQEHYSPGSIFKPITAIAGLSKKLITTQYPYYCSGNYQIHRTTWRCYHREGHGNIQLMEALKVSCDSYFYELGHKLGLDSLSQISARLGFGSKTEIALLGETSGILPTQSYYRKRFGYVAPGFVVNMAIGQGDLSVSPIQMAMAYGAIANGGIVYQPQIVTEILNEHKKSIKKFTKIVKSSVTDSASNFDEVLHGLSFVAETRGSAYSLRHKPENKDIADWIKKNNISIVGKTGTAQVVKLSKLVRHLDVDEVPYKHRDHAWFVGLYPKEQPKIVVVVMTEHGGFGGSQSAPVAVRLMKKWHEKNISKKSHGA
jgi:penicillin-binding protein 2